jgi:hypothetical protein
MKIKLNTTITPYIKDSVIKPMHPLWLLKNVGQKSAVINDIFGFAPGDTLGVDSLKLLLPLIEHQLATGDKNPIVIENDTQFTLTFDSTDNGFFPKILLIETAIKIEP